jgi:predicted GIY-YIG superfamily endonuclease
MPQMLLLPDPRPLVDQLGPEFFQEAPQRPGVYLMRDRADAVVYVGKAKNLRKRLASYRVANPDRLRPRHLKLLRAVARIEFEECDDEDSALAREAALLRALRPRFNKAGTWPGVPWFLGWRLTPLSLETAVAREIKPGWRRHGPFGAGVMPLRSALMRLLWCVLKPERRLWGMPDGWFDGRHGETAAVPRAEANAELFEEAGRVLTEFFAGRAAPLVEWIRAQTAAQTHPLEVEVRELDLETVTAFAGRLQVNRG